MYEKNKTGYIFCLDVLSNILYCLVIFFGCLLLVTPIKIFFFVLIFQCLFQTYAHRSTLKGYLSVDRRSNSPNRHHFLKRDHKIPYYNESRNRKVWPLHQNNFPVIYNWKLRLSISTSFLSVSSFSLISKAQWRKQSSDHFRNHNHLQRNWSLNSGLSR